MKTQTSAPKFTARDAPRQITTRELRSQSGERGTRVWIAYAGSVYDVTDCPKWRTGMHEQLHFAGQDLTSELIDAPHRHEVFLRPGVKFVGTLAVEHRDIISDV